MSDARKTGEQRIFAILQSAWPKEVPAPTLAHISLQYSARIHGLRKKGWIISNRVEIVNGVKHGFFRLGPRPVPSNAELRRGAEPSPTSPGLFGDIRKDRSYEQ